MTAAHAGMTFCGERLDDESEATYTNLSIALRKYIDENAADKIAPDYEKNLTEGHQRRGKADICRAENLRVAKVMLQGILAQESVMKTRKRLESPPGGRLSNDCL
jgi:hypothetical protein